MKGKMFCALAVAAVAVIAIGPANAGCSPDKAFSITFGDSGNFDVIFQGPHEVALGVPVAADDTTVSGAVIGRHWQPGARATTGENTGLSCPDDWWLLAPNGTGAMTIFGDNGADFGSGGQCDTSVCPAGSLIVLVQTKSTDGKNASYVVGRTSERASFPTFDFVSGTPGDWSMVDIARPNVTGSSRTAVDVTVQVSLASPSSAFHSPSSDSLQATGTVTGYQLVTFAGGADPGREAGLWTADPGGPIATTSPSASKTFPCPAGTSIFLANRPIFDGGQFAGDYVSASVRVSCANVATPGTPNKKPKPIINKKGVAEN